MSALLIIGLAFAVARAEVLDRVVVVVGDQVVLASDVRLEDALSEVDAGRSPFWDPRRADAQQRLVEAAIVRSLAGDVSIYQPTEEQVSARLEAVRGRFADSEAWEAFLREHGADEKEVRAILRRRLVVERWIARNVQLAPEDPAWWPAVRALLDGARPSVRVRAVEPRREPPP